MILTDDAALRALLQTPVSLAVLGAKDGEDEPAHYVPAYLHARGWPVIGVNPKLAGRPWLGATAVASLAELPAPVVGVEVFRRPDQLPAIVDELLALPWRPKFVWFQLGIRHDLAAARLSAAGIDVVQSRCMMPDHRRLVGG
jgi:predicted CoA-binding protein